MIAKINQRRLKWYFENVWLPAHEDPIRKRGHNVLVGQARLAVAEFCKYADRDPKLTEIDDAAMTEFEQFTRSQGFSARVARSRCDRLMEIVSHALPPSPLKPLPDQIAEYSMRQYARDEFPKVKPDLRTGTLKEYRFVANSFCRWYGKDICMADVTPELVEQFEGGDGETSGRTPGGVRVIAMRLRQLMRTYDPVKFRVRSGKAAAKRPDGTEGSRFLLINAYVNQYEPMALRSRRENTKRLYLNALSFFDKFLERPATLDDLNDSTVSAFATWRAEKVCGRTINKNLFCLLAIWRWCNRKGMIETWPDVQMCAEVQRTPVAWNESQLRKLYKTIGDLPGFVGQIPASYWWLALFLVAWDTGERINAILSLTWGQVDLPTHWVRFVAENRKGGRDDNSVELSVDAVAALRKISRSDGPVFPWPYSYTYIWKVLGDIVRAAELPGGRNFKFHCIRKSVASHYEAAGGNATTMLRHSRRKVTERYLDPKIARRQQPIDLLPRLVGRDSASAASVAKQVG